VSLTFDAGALIAFERNDVDVVDIVQKAVKANVRIAIPTGVVAQVWREGRTQARLSRLLRSRVVEIVPLDLEQARNAGAMCGRTSTADVIDASVVVCARHRKHGVVTSDPEDLHRLDPTLRLVVV
jgi:hypothetical protein